MKKTGANSPCPCGSGKKFKRCCGVNGGSAHSVIPLSEQARQRYLDGDWQGAAVLCDRALESDPHDALALDLMAAMLLQHGELAGALNLYQRLLEQQPDDANVHSNLCMTLHGLGEDDAAAQHCRTAIRLAPRLTEPHNNLGNIYKDLNDPLTALTHYEKAISLATLNPLVFVNAAVVCLELLRYEEAERYSSEALKLAPDFPEAINCQALALQGQGRFREAIKLYEKLLEIVPDNVEYLNNLGTLWKDINELSLAKAQFDAIVESQPEHIGARINLALVHDLGGHKEEADFQYREVLKREPGNAVALLNLGELIYEQGEQEEAVEYLIKGLESNPNSARGRASLAKALSRQGRYEPARQQLDRAMALSPDVAFIWAAKGNVEFELNHYEQATESWEHAIELAPSALSTYLQYAKMYHQQGDVDKYRELFQRGQEAVGDKPTLLISWANAEESNNQLEAAQLLVDKVAAVDAELPMLLRLQATLARRAKNYDEAYDYLVRISPEDFYIREQASAYYFELGAVQDKRGEYREAFAAYKMGNELKNAYTCRTYSDEEDQAEMRRRREFLVENMETLLAAYDEVPEERPQPVFIVGFPRSGTSLLEQVLGSHAEIVPAGELAFMPELTRGKEQEIIGSSLRYPDCLLDPAAPLDQDKLEALRKHYLDGVKDMGIIQDGTRWVTDKMPHNGLNAGLISLLFPKSPIIHISRHPLNPTLSAYFSNFNLGHSYTESLESTAKHYRNFMETLNYYKANLPMKFMEIHYEELVDDQERVVRELLEFIGAPWDENCLQHHKSKRLVKTASYEQVTQKVYRGSLERYKNYWEAVQPIIPILEKTIKDFGYTVEPPESSV